MQEHEKAAEICWSQKNFVQAIGHFLRSSSPVARGRASACLLDGLRTATPYGTNHRAPSALVKELFRLIDAVSFEGDELEEVSWLRDRLL